MFLRFARFLIGCLAVAASSFVVMETAEAQENYVIQPGDTLKIEVLEDSSLNRSVLVLPDGNISFPMAGSVPAKGKSVEQVRQELSAALTGSFAAPPNVYVSVDSLAPPAKPRGKAGARKMDVYAVGEVAQPGLQEVRRGTTLLQFLAEAGGLTKFAAQKRIELYRTDSRTGALTTYLFNYDTPAGGGGRISGGTRLAPGDVVKVPQRRLFE